MEKFEDQVEVSSYYVVDQASSLPVSSDDQAQAAALDLTMDQFRLYKKIWPVGCSDSKFQKFLNSVPEDDQHKFVGQTVGTRAMCQRLEAEAHAHRYGDEFCRWASKLGPEESYWFNRQEIETHVRCWYDDLGSYPGQSLNALMRYLNENLPTCETNRVAKVEALKQAVGLEKASTEALDQLVDNLCHECQLVGKIVLRFACRDCIGAKNLNHDDHKCPWHLHKILSLIVRCKQDHSSYGNVLAYQHPALVKLATVNKFGAVTPVGETMAKSTQQFLAWRKENDQPRDKRWVGVRNNFYAMKFSEFDLPTLPQVSVLGDPSLVVSVQAKSYVDETNDQVLFQGWLPYTTDNTRGISKLAIVLVKPGHDWAVYKDRLHFLHQDVMVVTTNCDLVEDDLGWAYFLNSSVYRLWTDVLTDKKITDRA